MNTSILRVQMPGNKRLLIASDIHAHGFLLQEALEKAAYAPESDILIIVGDMLEKGPDSLGTLRYVMGLAEKGTVYALMGNVDLWRYEHLLEEDEEAQREIIRSAFRCRCILPECRRKQQPGKNHPCFCLGGCRSCLRADQADRQQQLSGNGFHACSFGNFFSRLSMRRRKRIPPCRSV